ncbi:MAG: inositol-3-phosphate synthase [Candidatus Aenigmarchaeota archaeon]|nr:inositol-3-phosphate synthase [Candidatus Aenigmarchaeota archaeon]
MPKIRIAIAGVGNCASSLVQGIFYYKDIASNDDAVPGLMHNVLGGYRISDIEPVAAFDIDARKVGKDLSEAIFAKPNCTYVFQRDVPNLSVEVMKAPVLDGVASHMKDYPESSTFKVGMEAAADVADVLKEKKADMLINYLPVGSEEAAKYYANACLEAKTALVNCMPVFIASSPEWQKKFSDAKLPVIGDDIKSQVGATIVHRTLAKLFADRGVKIERMYQLNVGGNTDFLNMLARDRLASKKISKTQAVQSILPHKLAQENIHIGPSDYVPWLNDRKICFLRIEGSKFGGVPVELELRLLVEDSPNSAGSAIDAVRCCKIALDRGISGPLHSISAYTMKSPPQQFPDDVARIMVEEFIKGSRER